MPYPPLPKRVEYALKVLVCLAQCRGHPLRAQEVARIAHLSPAQAAKALTIKMTDVQKINWR